MMTQGDDGCLDKRSEHIRSLIGADALFQAGAMVKGGRRCALLQTCARWTDCAGAHEEFAARLAAMLEPRS